jgi:hypothetical protein
MPQGEFAVERERVPVRGELPSGRQGKAAAIPKRDRIPVARGRPGRTRGEGLAEAF